MRKLTFHGSLLFADDPLTTEHDERSIDVLLSSQQLRAHGRYSMEMQYIASVETESVTNISQRLAVYPWINLGLSSLLIETKLELFCSG